MGECLEHSPGDESLTLMRCHSCGLSRLYEALEGWKSLCGQDYNLNVINGKFFLFFIFVTFLPFYYPSFNGMMRTDPAVAGRGYVLYVNK